MFLYAFVTVYIVLKSIKMGESDLDIVSSSEKIVDLSNPLITADGKELVEQIYQDTIDPSDRGYKNLMRMMMEDGLFKYLPKNDEAWVISSDHLWNLHEKKKETQTKFNSFSERTRQYKNGISINSQWQHCGSKIFQC